MYIPSGQIVKLLSPGTYTLQFQNNAVFVGETKSVEVDFSLEYDYDGVYHSEDPFDIPKTRGSA